MALLHTGKVEDVLKLQDIFNWEFRFLKKANNAVSGSEEPMIQVQTHLT